MKRMNALLLAFVLSFGAIGVLAQNAKSTTVYSPEQLQADFRFMRDEIGRIHPDTGAFVSPEWLRKAYATVDAGLRMPLQRDEAWRTLATLNPVFSDAHMSITQPDWRAQTVAHLKGGGGLFPFQVQLNAAGDIYIRTELGGGISSLAGAKIETINGVSARQIGVALLNLTQGDTAELRSHLLSRRFWFNYWRVFGAPAQFEFTVAQHSGSVPIRVGASAATPPDVQANGELDFEQTFQFELLPRNAALLTIRQFLAPDKKAFYAWTHDVFQKLRQTKVQTLIIDVRDNTGGDDDMWKVGLLPYLATQPARNGSSYIKKVIAGRQSGNERVGDVVQGFGDTWVEPDLKNPLHFSGKTYVLVGRLTYSSAVLFSNVMQDFGFGQLVGAGGYARTRQTGGQQYITLPNTGLEVAIPRFILDRPSGSREPALVHPDIVLPDSPFNSRALIDSLVLKLQN
jgi:hypothetical protein